jgi:carbon monoxide dehydrogenase subunit G
MDLTGATDIPATPDVVWRGLNDPDVLSRAIPGSEGVTRLSDTEFEAVASAAIGPVKARFKGKVTLSNLKPPESYTIAGEGSGGVAGFAKGAADVRLETIPTGTRLHYTVKAQVGGKLAQIGQRLIDGAARKMADDFFLRFSQIVAEPVPVEAVPAGVTAPTPTPGSVAATPANPPSTSTSEGLPQAVWIPLLVAAVVAIVVAALVLT